VVGGTSYWIQNLMFPNRLAHEISSSDKCPSNPPLMSDELEKSITSLPPHLLDGFNVLPERPPSATTDPEGAFLLHAILSAIDPTVAARWHWRDTRKVLRSLCIIKETGRKTSEILSEQSRNTVKPRCVTCHRSPPQLTIL
jgi:tRNA dimethylallyltransferase